MSLSRLTCAGAARLGMLALGVLAPPTALAQSVRVTLGLQGVEFQLEETGDTATMRVVVLGPSGTVLSDTTSLDGELHWTPGAQATDGEYRYEILVWESATSEDRLFPSLSGRFRVADGVVVPPLPPAGLPATELLASDLVSASTLPSIFFDDTNDEDCTPSYDWRITTSGGTSNSDLNNFFQITGVGEFESGVCAQDIPLVVIHHNGFNTAESSVNSLVIAANGDISFANGAMTLDKSSATLAIAGGLVADGDVSLGSSRDLKHLVEPVALDATLDAVLALELYRWTYRNDESAALHLGPMAEEVHGRLGLGRDEKHLSPADTAGLALAALQALHHRFEETTRRLLERNQELDAQNHRLEERLRALEARSPTRSEASFTPRKRQHKAPATFAPAG